MTIGAPINEVIMLIGKLPLGKICAIHENNNMEKIPAKITKTYNLITWVFLKTILQICGIARPIKAIGPTKAVAAAVRIAEEIKINQRTFLMLIPMLCA